MTQILNNTFKSNQMPNNDYVIYTDKISRYISTANRIEQKV